MATSTRRHRRQDLLAGLSGAIGGVPEAMAAAALAGINPVHGLYAAFVGPVAGGLCTGTRLMVVSTTGAAALAAGSAVAGLDPTRRPEALFLLTVLAGVVVVLAGLARFGRYVRFISHAVVLGLLAGVAVDIVAGQLPALLGVRAEGPHPLAKAFDALLQLSHVEPGASLAGLWALAILVALARSRFTVLGGLLALAVPTAVVSLAGLDVPLVRDAGAAPPGVPLPHLPDLGVLSPDLVVGAVVVAVVVLVQGAAVGQAAPNPDGSPADTDRDVLAQGVANVAAGLWRGQPVAGSGGRTEANARAGARTRWAAVWSGVWVLLALVLFSRVVGQVAMPTLAAVLIVGSAGALRPRLLGTVLRTGPVSQVAFVTTFLATLFLPIAVAVGTGVVLSLLSLLNREAMDARVVEVVPRADGRCTERPVPPALTDHEVTVLDVYGSLLFAGAPTLRAKLPDPAGSCGAVVVLRLRGEVSLGSTFFAIAADYARRLDAAGGRLYLSGVDRRVVETFRRTGKVALTGPVRLFGATDVLWGSTEATYRDAETWVVRHRDDPAGEPAASPRGG